MDDPLRIGPCGASRRLSTSGFGLEQPFVRVTKQLKNTRPLLFFLHGAPSGARSEPQCGPQSLRVWLISGFNIFGSTLVLSG